MTNFFLISKTYFWPISPILGAKKDFQKKSGCHAQLHKRFQHSGKIQRNLMIKFQENTQTDVRREGWTDPISQDPSSYRQGANKYNCSRLAFKSKKKCTIGLIKNRCITASMQKISPIHKLIQHILGYHEMTMPTFDQAHPKIIEITLYFPEFAPPCKNQFIPSIQY